MLASSALGQRDFAMAQAAPRAAVTATGLYANASGKADQEFFRMPNSFSDETPQELIAFGDGQFCVGTPKGIIAGDPRRARDVRPQDRANPDTDAGLVPVGRVPPSLYTYQPSIPARARYPLPPAPR